MKFHISKEWCAASARKEGDSCVRAGLPSVLGLSKIAAPQKRVGSGRLVGRAVPVGVLREMAASLEQDAKDQGALATEFNRLRMHGEAAKRRGASDIYADIAQRLRLLAGDTTERQPLPNTTLSHAGTQPRKQDGAATGVGSGNS